MFCPKCATQNVDGASFCRSCGANIGMVQQAMTGQLPTAPAPEEGFDRYSRRMRRRNRTPTIDEGVRNLMMGIAFVIISVLIGRYSPGGWTWWYWMLIPAATFLGRGLSNIIRANQEKNQLPGMQPTQPQISGINNPMPSLPPRSTSELMAPVPSVTEGTTRHLGAEAPTRHFDPATGEEKP